MVENKMPRVPMNEPEEVNVLSPEEYAEVAIAPVRDYDDGSVSLSQRAVWSQEPPKPSEMKMPFFRLMQALSEDVKNGVAIPGEFRVDGYPELELPVRLVPLMRAVTRTYRDMNPNAAGEFEVFCQSVDARTGVGNPGGNCHTCPKAQWGANKMPPECTETYSYICYLPSIDMPIVWNLQKSGVQCARRIDQFAMRGWGSFAIECTQVNKRGVRGDYFAPVVTKYPLAEHEAQAVQELKDWMSG